MIMLFLVSSLTEFIPEYLHFRYYSTGMVKYFFDINVDHYVIQHPTLVPEV